jgi:hypothetical protein
MSDLRVIEFLLADPLITVAEASRLLEAALPIKPSPCPSVGNCGSVGAGQSEFGRQGDHGLARRMSPANR